MKTSNYNLFIEKDYEALSKRAATIYTDAITTKPTGAYGFATGSTPLGMYKELITRYNNKEVDFSRITTFNLDEYYPISKNNTRSYDYFMHTNLFDYINVESKNIHLPNGEAADPQLECLAYEEEIENAGGIDMQLLGIGLNGHIGFNEPDAVFTNKTNLITLAESTLKANARFFDTPEEIPRHAITMGIRSIMMSRRILLLISGADKADIAWTLIHGDISPQIPATVLRLHHDVTVILDEAAAQKIK